MLLPLRDRSFWQILTLLAILGGGLLWPLQPVGATVFDWDNSSGDKSFDTRVNWNPYPNPPSVPAAGDTAIFDGQLLSYGPDKNVVEVPHGTEINDMQVYNSTGFPATVVDLTIGDGTTASRFDLDATNSLIVGNTSDDTATLNLRGGWFDTLEATIGGKASFNVLNAGSLWDSTSVVISGDTGVSDTAGIGLGLRAQIATHGDLEVGDSIGSGRVVVENTGTGTTPTQWTVDGSVDIGSPFITGFSHMNYGHVTLQTGGQMSVGADVDIHSDETLSTLTVKTGGTLDVAGRLNIFRGGRLQLYDPTSTITTGEIDLEAYSFGVLDWTGGTLHITNSSLDITDTNTADLDMDNLAVDSGMTLKVSSPSESLRIGSAGTGVMTVQNGGVVESSDVIVGGTTGDGTVHVVGSQSRLTAAEVLYVGGGGSTVGRLNLSDGEVEAHSIFLGMLNTADGTITVDDATLTSGSVLAVGGYITEDGTATVPGGTGQLTIQNGGQVNVASTLIVFGGGTVELLGSEINAGSFLNDQGGTFTHEAGTLTVDGGTFAPNAGGSYSINGPDALSLPTVKLINGATYTSTGTLFVGNSYNGVLEIRDGSTVNTLNGRVGYLAGDSQGAVIVDGNQSQWINSASVEIGVRNNGLMRISNGGRVEGTGGVIGAVTGSEGTVVVETEGVWDNSHILFVGGTDPAGGTGNLTILDGGQVNVGQPTTDGLVKLFPSGGVHIYTGGKLEANTVLLEPGAMSNFVTDLGSTLQVNSLIGFGPNPVFGGNLTIGSANWPHWGHIAVSSGESLMAESILVGGDAVYSTLNVESGRVAVAAGMALTPTGRLVGAGEVVTPLLENSGVVAPGNTGYVGTLTVDGDYEQLTPGLLEIDIGGEIPGLEFDTLFITDAALLDGILDVSLIDPLGGTDVFVPRAGHRVEILGAIGGLGGTTFDTVPADLPALTGALEWDIFYGSGFVRLDVSTPFTADFDGDGDVDADDLGKWQGDYGGPGSDADGDGDSDGADFLAWQQQNGSGVTPLASSRGVPEPSTLLLLGLGAIGLITRRGRWAVE